MPTKVEQIVHSGMGTQKTLCLLYRFELAHTPLSNSRRLMRQLSSIVRISRCIVNRLWNQFSVRDSIAPQFIRHDLSWLTLVIAQ